MTKYHLHPETGDPGVCKAKKNCPFGDMETDHYSSAEAAREAYEAKQRPFSSEPNVVEYAHEVPLDADTLKLLDLISGEGVQPLVVGGAVRDSLVTNTIPKDVDIEVHGVDTADELLAILKKHGYKVDEVGKSFGVLTTKLPNGMDIDVSLPRRDSLVGDSHKDFEVVVDTSLTLSEAANRRDFTINALYYDHKRKVVLDAHNGMKDWEEKRLQRVSDAFSEDPLRVLRAVQFSSRFNLTITDETAAEARRISDKFDTISTERVQEEWTKLFVKGKSLKQGLETLQATGWDRHFGFDKIDIDEASRDADAAMAAADAEGLERQYYGPAALAAHLPESDRLDFLKQSIIGDKHSNKMNRLISTPLPSKTSVKEINRWARGEVKHAGGAVREWDAIHGGGLDPALRADIVAAAKEGGSWEAPKPDYISGQMILDGMDTKRGGPWVGELQREAQEAQDNERFRNADEAANWLRLRLRDFTLPENPRRK